MACAPKASEELDAIDSLRSLVRESEELLNTVDVDQLKSMKEIMEEDLAFMKTHELDSADQQFWAKTASDYYRFNKNVGKFLDKREKLLDEIEYSYSQLGNLKKDLNARVLDKRTFAEYYALEAEAVQKLQSIIAMNVRGVMAFIPRFDELKAEVHAHINPLRDTLVTE